MDTDGLPGVAVKVAIVLAALRDGESLPDAKVAHSLARDMARLAPGVASWGCPVPRHGRTRAGQLVTKRGGARMATAVINCGVQQAEALYATLAGSATLEEQGSSDRLFKTAR